MKTVYRIETKTGHGICAAMGSNLCSLYRQQCHNETEHSLFNRGDEHKAARLCGEQRMVFAFPTIDALKIWFPTPAGRATMQEHGAICVPYTVPDVELATEYQCIFDKSKAAKGEPIDLVSLD